MEMNYTIWKELQYQEGKPASLALYEQAQRKKSAGKYHPPKKKKKGGFIKMERYDNTPMMELQKGLFQHGHIWRILDTMAPSTIKLYFTMVSMAILAPIPGNRIAMKCYKKYLMERNEIVVGIPYREAQVRCNISSRDSISDALKELKALGLIQDTADTSVYRIGYITDDETNFYRLYLHDKLESGPGLG
jgi:hypothetical protein